MVKKLKDKKIEIYSLISTGMGSQQSVECVKITDTPVWAYYRQLAGDIVLASHTTGFKEEVSFTINWRDDIEAGMFIKYQGKSFYITRLDNFEGYKSDITLFCQSSTRKLD